jgi:hypothetical protein
MTKNAIYIASRILLLVQPVLYAYFKPMVIYALSEPYLLISSKNASIARFPLGFGTIGGGDAD